MLILMTSLTFVFFWGVARLVRRLIQEMKTRANEELSSTETAFEKLTLQQRNASQKRMEIETEAGGILALYELTRELTKNFREEEILSTFQQKLADYMSFGDCQILDVESPDIERLRSAKNYFLFPLQAEGRKFGYLALQGVSPREEETINILGHQLALALRRVKLYREIEKLAMTDSLTAVYTRRYFMERFLEEFKRSQRRHLQLSFLMIDVDHFKSFNDRYGHLVGDQILREAGGIINGTIREIDFAGRYGGEEFCVALPDTGAEGARYVAERIRSSVEKASMKAYDTTTNVTISIGVATYPTDAQASDELIDKSDWALYRAKKNGRNCIYAFGNVDNLHQP